MLLTHTRLSVVFATLFTLNAALGAPTKEHHKYCIIGAGPAGVQLGHFMWNAPGGRDYITLEAKNNAAAFFQKYPIHRTLNSINRRHTRSKHWEVNMRHDWNSLIGGEDRVGLFGRNWSKEYWPPADTLVEYINAFAEPQVESGHIQYCQEVTQVSACKKGASPKCAYKLQVRRACQPKVEPSATCKAKKGSENEPPHCSSSDPSAENREITCEVLVMANGMWKPRVVKDWVTDLQEHSIRYDDMGGIKAEEFEDKSVLIFGHGNAAVETMDNLRNHARDMVIVSRSKFRFLQGSRYVGDVRARRTTHIDANSFKSYEGATEMSANASMLVATECGPDEENTGFRGKPPVCIFTMMHDKIVTLAPIMPAYQGLINEAKRLFGDKVWEMPAEIHQAEHAKAGNNMFKTINYPAPATLAMHVDTLRKAKTLEQRKILIKLRDTTKYTTIAGMEFQKPFDAVITALGWTYNKSIFDKSVKVAMMGPPHRQDTDKEVYPNLNEEFESTSAPNMHFVGSASHGRDRYRYKASGGFIHGFRFNTRTVWRILQGRYESPPDKARSQPPLTADGSTAFDWTPKMVAKRPKSKDFGLNLTDAEGKSKLWAKLIDRMNTAAGPYEQVAGSLADGIVYDCKNKTAWYMEDLPEDVINDRYIDSPRITWSYYYGSNTYLRETSVLCSLRSPRTSILGSFVHPVVQYFPPGVRPPFPHERDWNDMMGVQMHARTGEHPSIFWEPLAGVKRVHLMDQFVWGDWNDPETLGVLEPFMKSAETAIAKFCIGKGTGEVSRNFDEVADVRIWQGPEYKDELKRNAGACGFDMEEDNSNPNIALA